MSFFVKRNLLFRICLVAFAVLYALLQTGYVIAMENKSVINSALKVTDYEMVAVEGEDQDTDYYKSDYSNLADLMQDGQALAEKVEAEGAVLLKNDNDALPLSQNAYVALFGYASVDPAYGGSGSAASDNPKTEINFWDGFTQAGLSVNKTLYDFYKVNASRYAPSKYDTRDASWGDLVSDSSVSASFDTVHDAAIVVIRRSRGENADPSYEYLQLSANERSLLLGLKEQKGAKFDKIIVLFNTANQVEADFLNDADYGVDAALWIGTIGQTGAKAVGDILTGKVNPSGKLSDTFWTKHAYNPAMANFGVMRYANASDFSQLPSESNNSYTKMSNTAYVAYAEGIYVGYRYTETRYEDVVSKRNGAGEFDYNQVVAYPFGYGLSYTTFDYSDFATSYNRSDDTFTITFTVKNSGSVAGRESCQVYLSKPYTQYDADNGIEKAAVELVGFTKTKLLAPDEVQECSVTVEGSALASYDANNAKTYVTSEGDYFFTVGKNAHDAVNNVLAAKGYGIADGMTEDGNEALVKKVAASKQKYNKSATGAEITNLFDSSDWNKYANNGGTSIVYVSRSNWNDTLPQTMNDRTTLYMTAEMVQEILSYTDSSSIAPDEFENPSLGENNGLQLVELMTDSDGNKVAFDSEVWDLLVSQLSWDELCALITTGMRKTAAAASVGKPATIEHNGPTGVTERYDIGESVKSGYAYKINDPDKEYSPSYYPCLGILAATFDTELANRVGKMYGEDALWAGYSGLYGIGLNIHRTAYDGRAFEYYSEDSYLSGIMAANLVSGLQSKGCNGYVKHLVGYEQQGNRIGLAVWTTEQTLREIYLKPFYIAITQGGAMNCMAAYTRLGTQFCAGNKALLTDFLRGECGMEGFVVSDMYAGRYNDSQLPMFLMAGCDLPDGDLAASIYADYEYGYSQVVSQMKLAAKRILYATVRTGAMNGWSSNMRIVMVPVAWQVALLAATIVCGVLFAASLAGFVLGNVRIKQKAQE